MSSNSNSKKNDIATIRRTVRADYRSKIIIIYQILNHIRDNRIENREGGNKNPLTGHRISGISRLMYGIRTSYSQFRFYMRLVIEKGLVTKEEYDGDSATITSRFHDKNRSRIYSYTVTEKGLRFMQYVEQMKGLVDDKSGFLFPKNLELD